MSKTMRLLLIGCAGLAMATTLSLVVPDPGVVGGTAIVLMLSMSAALCGAAVPGVIQVDSKAIRATGAAVFFVVPWVIPAAPVVASQEEGDPIADESIETGEGPKPDSAADAKPDAKPNPGQAAQPDAKPAPAGGAPAGSGTTPKGATKPSGSTMRPPAPKPGSTFKPPALPGKEPAKPAAKPRIARPRTVLDGLFSQQK